MSPNKETSMLCDIQYVRPNKKEGTPDYLYIIWRDLKTQEKFLKCIPEPKMDIYFEKNELRDHSHNKVYEKIENLEKRTVKYNDILNEIANDMGSSGKAMLENAYKTGNMDLKRQLYLYPYVFGADYHLLLRFCRKCGSCYYYRRIVVLRKRSLLRYRGN